MRDIVVKARREVRKEVRPPPAKRRFKIKAPPVRTLYLAGGGVFVFILGFLALNFFGGVRVVITPRQEFQEVSSVVRASAGTGRDAALETISLEDFLELERPVSGVKKIEEKARGQVVIFNSYSTEPQPLVSGTRLEAPNGNIYRITSPVRVPGAKSEGGKITAQGIEVAVVADKPGEAYNLGLSDFTIPGFKGSARYEKFYGRSKSEITGGFSGEGRIVSEEEVRELFSQAEATLRSALSERVKKDLPAGIFLVESAEEFDSTLEKVEPPLNSPGESVRVRTKGMLRAFALKEKEIANFLARSYLSLNPGEEVWIANLDALTTEVVSKNFLEGTLTLRFEGRAHFVWTLDAEALKAELAAASRQKRREIFRNYPAIERAEIHFRPAWWRIFPQNPSRIRIERVLRTE